MADVVHLIGNGRSASYFDHNSKGTRVTCNLPPYAIQNVYATCLVDFKMMRAIHEGSVQVPGEWILGKRPKIYMEQNPSFHMKYAKQIRGFYLNLPGYVANYTDFNCGHMATHFSATRFEPKELHMYGFNSVFDFDVSSCTDMYMESDRSAQNNNRLVNNWRGIWPKMFAEFPNTEFVLYHKHDNIKAVIPENVRIVVK